MRLRTPLAVLGSAALALGILSAGTTPAAPLVGAVTTLPPAAFSSLTAIA